MAAKKKYEILHGIRLDEETGTQTEGVVELTDEEATVFLDREAVRLIPGQKAHEPEEAADRGTPPASPETATLSVPPEHGRDLLVAGGFGSDEKIKAAPDANLLAVDGIGPGRLKQIRADVAGA
jgi:hypothetical protein